MTELAPPAWGTPRTKTISWYDPEVSLRALGEMSGLEYLTEMAEGRLPPPPIASIFGMELVSVASGEAVFRCAPDESMLNPIGLVHGGVLCTLMDAAMGVSVQSRAARGVGYASIELKVSFLRPLSYDGRPFEVRGHALRVGRNVAFAEAHAYGADGTLVGHATSSLAAVGG